MHCKGDYGLMGSCLCKGSGRTLQQREGRSVDEYERSSFHQPTQIRTSSTRGTHATVDHDGKLLWKKKQFREESRECWETMDSSGNQSYGNVTTATGKKVICYNCRGEGHVARQCKEPNRAKGFLSYFQRSRLTAQG
ncbi:reverse transcriptase domain-containing protein [Tanacetum coccineum]|uniref:Reverse transcriptase domain-containing protein n=1 Tax=Tanacetum coccineum TaxID=301880 RepID=A0ABQ5B2K7_9ASTR